jgi:hypothetical protein
VVESPSRAADSKHASKYFGRLDPIQDLKSAEIGGISAAGGAAQKGLAQPNLLHRSNRRHAMCRNIVESQPVANQIAALADTKAGTYCWLFSLRHLSSFRIVGKQKNENTLHNFRLARDPSIDESLVQSRADLLVQRRNPFYFLQCASGVGGANA